jgi:hypothetical protein
MDETKLREAVAELMKDQYQRKALAEMIIEYVQPNHITKDFISLLLDSRSLKPGDSLVKKIRKGIRVHTWVPGSIGLKSEVTVSDRINHVLDGAQVGVMANEWDLRKGELGTVDDLKTECQAKLRDHYMNKVFTALTTIWNGSDTPSNYVEVSSAVNATVLKNAIDTINQTTPGVKAVVGLRSLLTPVTTFGASWSDGSNSFAVDDNIKEIMKTGFLGVYYGAPLIALNQIYDNPEDYNALLPTDKILVIGEKVGEFITYGSEESKEWTDMRPTPPYWHLDIWQQFGLMIDNAQGIYTIKVV